MTLSGLSLEEWVKHNAGELKENIDCHISVMADTMAPDDAESLARLILISVREWQEKMQCICSGMNTNVFCPFHGRKLETESR